MKNYSTKYRCTSVEKPPASIGSRVSELLQDVDSLDLACQARRVGNVLFGIIDLPNRVIEHYQILDQVGHGAMGVVYAAQDLKLERRVAIKRLGARGADDVDQVRLLREARAMAQLAHPNVVSIFEFFIIKGTILL